MEKKKRRKCWIPSLLCLVFLLHSSANATTFAGPKSARQNHQFVLVHGACHGAWSWYKLLGLLRSSGHNVTAVDLAGAGINPKGVGEVRRQGDYFRPLMELMASVPAGRKQVILVAHSLGGFAVSKAMEMFPEKISVAVFVTAFMPGPSLNATTVLREVLLLLHIIFEPISYEHTGSQDGIYLVQKSPIVYACFTYHSKNK